MGYERRIGNVLPHIQSSSEDDWSLILDHFFDITRLTDHFYAISSWAYCTQDMYFKFCMYINSLGVVLGWQKSTHLPYRLSRVCISTPVAQYGGLYNRAFGGYPYHLRLFQRITIPYSWRTEQVSSGSGIMRLQNIASFLLCVSLSSHVRCCWLPMFRFMSNSFVSWCSCHITGAFAVSCSRIWILSSH